MKVLFAHPSDVAFADQAAAASRDIVVRLRRLVPAGRMYLVAHEQARRILYGFELEQRAERVITTRRRRPYEDVARR